jgi:tetratricopeptide (TPR) repeat protein
VPTPERRFLEEFERALKAQARLDTREEALEAFTECARLAPPWFRIARSWRALLADELDAPQALAWLEEAVAEDPMAVRAACALGRRRAEAGDWEAAEALFRDATGANPDWPSAWEGLALVASNREDWEGALTLAGRSLQLWSTNPTALLLYGGAALRLGLPDHAEEAFQRALLLVPESRDARSGLLAVGRLREDAAASAGAGTPPGG